jgi:hypothetical protein
MKSNIDWPAEPAEPSGGTLPFEKNGRMMSSPLRRVMSAMVNLPSLIFYAMTAPIGYGAAL